MSVWELLGVFAAAVVTAAVVIFLVIVFVAVGLGTVVDRHSETQIRVGDEAEKWLKEHT